ncbi:MAG TPA: Nif3-like dinuclear metal center hexameric protein, partial [Gemmatimonadota bacterium]|nr:Nif3-like dinuclear metal center hexameric protein [Gemmatimonadota bacterium]
MKSAASRDALVAYLDEFLDTAAWTDKSLNGLQVEGAERVSKVALATDTAQATIDMAIDAGAELMIAHHGLFWGRVEPVTGPLRARLASLLRADLSLYVSHLPLDAHTEVGNNAVLARLLELRDLEPFGSWGSGAIGVMGRLPETLDRAGLAARLEALLGERPQVLPFGTDVIARVAVVSGAAADLIPEAAGA